ncbi:MAG: hypothetical protein EBR86_04550, partial [Planctomycetia bacterium]|nr:hypothetical protein [Planctomycetia bacterium]
MVMLRCPRVLGIIVLALACGAVIDRVVPIHAAEPGTPAAEKSTAPRTLLRMPKWMDRLTGRGSATRVKPADGSAATPPAPHTATPAATRSGGTAVTAPAIAATPSSTAEGKPGRSLLRSRATAPVDTRGSLLGGWGELAS